MDEWRRLVEERARWIVGFVDVTEEFDPRSLEPGERVYRVRYVEPCGYVNVKHVALKRRAADVDPLVAALRELVH